MYDFLDQWIPAQVPFLLAGAVVTLELTLLSMSAAIVLGLLVALGRQYGGWSLNWALRGYVETCRNVPLIVQLLIIYFSLPEIGISMPAFWAGVMGLSLNLGAYISEVFRAAIESIDSGQRDAGFALGMSRLMVFRNVILPQAFLIALPTLGGYFIALLKDCSLVSFISVNELLRHGAIIIMSTFQSMQVYLTVGFLYFVMSFIAARCVDWIERMLTARYRPGR